MKKFLQSVDDDIYKRVEKICNKKGITIQELIRVVILPKYLEDNNG